MSAVTDLSKGGRYWAVAELLLAAVIVAGANLYDFVPISETPWLLLVGWLSLRRRGLGWKALGLRRPANGYRTFAYALLAALALQLLSEFVIEPLTGRPDLADFAPLVGNLPATLGMLLLVWTLAAFGEEMVYRGYVLERAAALGGHSQWAYLVSVLAVSLLFGIGHYYQGAGGVIGSSVSGALFGLLYLASGRNLWLPILAHGLSDTIGLALIYAGLAPGLPG